MTSFLPVGLVPPTRPNDEALYHRPPTRHRYDREQDGDAGVGQITDQPLPWRFDLLPCFGKRTVEAGEPFALRRVGFDDRSGLFSEAKGDFGLQT
jgi:hypothetical protein